MDELHTKLEEALGKGRVEKRKNLSHYLTIHSQTAAEYYFEAQSRKDWEHIAVLMTTEKVPIFVLGGGSNLAVTHDLLPGLIVRNAYVKKEIVIDAENHVDLLVSSGYPVARLVAETTASGYEGLEYQLGLPGTVGGAIYMNSKWTHPISYCGDHLIAAYLLERTGSIKKVDRDYFKFAYDYSIVQETKEIILEVVFRFKKTDAQVLQKRAQEALRYRRDTQPHGVATSGCFFQNISKEDKAKHYLPTTSAGYLIDKAGLKGLQVGDFVVSNQHANFVINTGRGTAKDLRTILSMIKDRVKEKYGVTLKEEVIVI